MSSEAWQRVCAHATAARRVEEGGSHTQAIYIMCVVRAGDVGCDLRGQPHRAPGHAARTQKDPCGVWPRARAISAAGAKANRRDEAGSV